MPGRQPFLPYISGKLRGSSNTCASFRCDRIDLCCSHPTKKSEKHPLMNVRHLLFFLKKTVGMITEGS